jgi:hypothetical protein
MPQADRDWIARSVEIIEADFNRSADTHLLLAPMPPIGRFMGGRQRHCLDA